MILNLTALLLQGAAWLRLTHFKTDKHTVFICGETTDLPHAAVHNTHMSGTKGRRFDIQKKCAGPTEDLHASRKLALILHTKKLSLWRLADQLTPDPPPLFPSTLSGTPPPRGKGLTGSQSPMAPCKISLLRTADTVLPSLKRRSFLYKSAALPIYAPPPPSQALTPFNI